MSGELISVEELATALGVTDRAARKICQAERLRGCPITVHRSTGRGGRAGIRYCVEVASLPAELREKLPAEIASTSNGPHALVEQRSNTARNGAESDWMWRHKILAPALTHAKGTPERKAAIDLIAGASIIDRRGRRREVSARTLQHWAKRLEEEGFAGLSRQPRADRGERRVAISRAWDAAVPFDKTIKREIAEFLRQEIRALRKKGAPTSKVQLLARECLKGLTLKHGYRVNDDKNLDRICHIPKHLALVDAAELRKVCQHRFDRKASEDDRPRIRRTIKGLRPMQIVVMDVHPVDVLVRRSDGSTATPRLLGFMDMATRRVWCELVFLDRRGGVRNTDLIEAFVAMATHPAFGLPENIYVDNGSEYLFADFLNDALKLRSLPRDGHVGPIIRAKPYNAAAKPIEAWFAHFEQHYLRHSQGWIGGDRMNKKQQVLGKAPPPCGDFSTFAEYCFAQLHAYEHVPQQGALRGKSPAQVFQERVDSGWSATVMDPENLLSVFTRPEVRVLKQHSFSLGGRVWTSEELAGFLGDRVVVQVPVYHGYNELLVLDEDGKRICIARPQEEFDYLDPRGARRSASWAKARNAKIRALDKSVPEVDVGARLIAFGQSRQAVVPNAPNGVVSVNGGERPARLITPESRPDDADEAARQENRKRLALAQQLLGKRSA